MKRIICFICCVGLFAMVGCDNIMKIQKPEDVGKKYIEEKFKEKEFDVSGLEYTVVEGEKGTAVVKVSGAIAFKEELQLVKKDGIWKMVTEAEK